jgi:hypothetical protein
MRILLLILLGCFFLSGTLTAQKRKISRYQTFVYTSDKIDLLIQDAYKNRNESVERGLLGDLGNSVLNAGKGIAGGYVTSLLDLGVNSVAALLTKNATNKLKWEAIVKGENNYQETIATVEPINNFYTRASIDGPMDPAGMTFNGIGCLRTVDGDTTFYISCHIDQSKINRIINHSKFELSLDTLTIDPYNCDLPNSAFDTAFSFDRRNNLQMVIEMRLKSSWINQWTQVQNNQELGSFILTIPVNKSDLDTRGKLRFIKTANTPAKYKIVGESFIIPRSYMGFRDKDNHYYDSWGTGDYQIELSLKESCGITDIYHKEWKKDWKSRNQNQASSILQRSWKTISAQKWDDIGKKWIVTTLKAPADMINKELLDELNLPAGSTSEGK